MIDEIILHRWIPEFSNVLHSIFFLTDQNLSEKVIVLGSYRNYQLNMQPKTSTPKLHLCSIQGTQDFKNSGII